MTSPAPTDIEFCGAYDPQVQLILLFQEAQALERVGAGGLRRRKQVSTCSDVLWVPFAYSYICSELRGGHF